MVTISMHCISISNNHFYSSDSNGIQCNHLTMSPPPCTHTCSTDEQKEQKNKRYNKTSLKWLITGLTCLSCYVFNLPLVYCEKRKETERLYVRLSFPTFDVFEERKKHKIFTFLDWLANWHRKTHIKNNIRIDRESFDRNGYSF